MSTNQLAPETVPQTIDNTKTAVPTKPSERIIALDALRGFAILGILAMNIQSFADILAAYANPVAYENLIGLNKWIWILSHTFFSFKFMALFAMMFGAGIILMTQCAEAKGVSPAKLHYRRNFWLLLFGLVHAYFVWMGDILAIYAVCGFVVYIFRKRSPRLLIIIGLILLAIPSVMSIAGSAALPSLPVEIVAELKHQWGPPAEIVADEIASYQGGWWQQMRYRVPQSLEMHIFVFVVFSLWRVCGLMLWGMALFKLGVFTAERSKSFYGRFVLFGFLAGFPLVIYGIAQNFAHDWDFAYSMFIGTQFNYWGSLFVSLGYIGMVMFIAKSEWMPKVVNRFAAVGRMALTNYFMQTIICTTIFYGHGLGLFGQVERTGQVLIVLVVWAFQLIVSPLWLDHYRFGPFEWLWRSLTYWKLQPMRKLQTAQG